MAAGEEILAMENKTPLWAGSLGGVSQETIPPSTIGTLRRKIAFFRSFCDRAYQPGIKEYVSREIIPAIKTVSLDPNMQFSLAVEALTSFKFGAMMAPLVAFAKEVSPDVLSNSSELRFSCNVLASNLGHMDSYGKEQVADLWRVCAARITPKENLRCAVRHALHVSQKGDQLFQYAAALDEDGDLVKAALREKEDKKESESPRAKGRGSQSHPFGNRPGVGRFASAANYG